MLHTSQPKSRSVTEIGDRVRNNFFTLSSKSKGEEVPVSIVGEKDVIFLTRSHIGSHIYKNNPNDPVTYPRQLRELKRRLDGRVCRHGRTCDSHTRRVLSCERAYEEVPRNHHISSSVPPHHSCPTSFTSDRRSVGRQGTIGTVDPVRSEYSGVVTS